jgi:hypothetical protein
MVLVLLAHVPLVLLFLWGWRISRDEPETSLVFLGIWPQMRNATTQPLPQTLPPAPAPAPVRSAPRTAVKVAAPPEQVDQPSTSITLPAESAADSGSPRPSIDWRAEGVAAAARQAAPAASATFTEPPKTVHKPCEKKKTTWEWNKEPGRAGVTKLSNGIPLPYVTVGRCVIGLGFFGCSPQKPPEANSHLLDDMRDGKTSPSSVPDPDRCD